MDIEFPLARSRAYRCLSNSPHYHGLLADSPTFDSEYAKNVYPVQLDLDEYLVGVYENKFGEKVYELPPETKIWDTIVITIDSFMLHTNK